MVELAGSAPSREAFFFSLCAVIDEILATAPYPFDTLCKWQVPRPRTLGPEATTIRSAELPICLRRQEVVRCHDCASWTCFTHETETKQVLTTIVRGRLHTTISQHGLLQCSGVQRPASTIPRPSFIQLSSVHHVADRHALCWERRWLGAVCEI